MEMGSHLQSSACKASWGRASFGSNAETSFADTEDLLIGWQTRHDLQRRGIVEVVEHDRE